MLLKLQEMIGKKLLLATAAGALLLLQFGDCMSAMGQDQYSMKCCAAMPCTLANHGQTCCKKMISAQTPYMLPADHVSLHGPAVATVEYPPMLDVVRPTSARSVTIIAQQHSPPDLYTLNAALLI
jgi:hypothetical protein